jgi:acetolactate synthase-1/2/3 large subunit
VNLKICELITEVLDAQGIRTVAALAGASHTLLLDALDRRGFTILSSRHESGCVGAADGYARGSGKLGVALVVSDQGLANAVGGLAVAFQALSPVLLLVATPPRAANETETAIDQDKLSLVAPVSKWARNVPSAERLQDFLETAIKQARSGRPGPAVLLIPQNLFGQTVPYRAGPQVVTSRAMPNPDAIDRLAHWIIEAERPMVVVGAGAAVSGAASALRQLSHHRRLPVLMNGLGRGQVPEDDDLGFPWPFAQCAAHRADLVLLVGARLTQRLGLGLPPRFSPTARFAQIDIAAEAFHRNRPTDLPIHADARAAIEALDKALERIDPGGTSDTHWMGPELASRRNRIEALTSDRDPIHPLSLAAEVAARLEDGIFVADGADISTWMYGHVRIRRPRGFADHYPMGAMGSCTALAVGMAAWEKEHAGDDAAPTVLVTGDGALGFHPAELHAAVRAGLRLVVVVGNDGAWGTELHGQREAIGRDVNTELGQLPYHKLGEALGAEGACVRSFDHLPAALDRAFAYRGCTLVNVHIDPEAGQELKTNDAVRMILFNDIVQGQADLDPFNPNS